MISVAIKITLTTVLAGALVISGGVSANAASPTEPNRVYQALAAVHEVDANGQQGPALTADLVSDGGAKAGITLPSNASTPLTFSGRTSTVQISLPNSASSAPAKVISPGVKAYADRASYASTPIALADGSVRLANVKYDSSAPSTLSYRFSGMLLEADETGVVTIRNAAGDIEGWVAGAQATDAAGAAVPTSLSAQGDSLIQTVQPTASTQFPVVTAALAAGTYIASVTTAYRDSRGPTKVVTPTALGRTIGSGLLYVYLQSEYDQRVTAAYRSVDMHYQLLCHVDFAPFKSTWNLDSYLRRGNFAAYVANACN